LKQSLKAYIPRNHQAPGYDLITPKIFRELPTIGIQLKYGIKDLR
jgi:hypothetical protein